MTERFPDLEIYLMKADPAKVSDWLSSALGALETVKDTGSHQHWRSGGMDIFMNANAEKNFSSLWFKKNDTPWNTDLEAARAAWAALETEVRCSDSGWDESENDSGSEGWVKLNARGEKPFNW